MTERQLEIYQEELKAHFERTERAMLKIYDREFSRYLDQRLINEGKDYEFAACGTRDGHIIDYKEALTDYFEEKVKLDKIQRDYHDELYKLSLNA